MKIYVKYNNEKIYLNYVVSTRSELARLIGSPWFNLNGKRYHVHQVIAESPSVSTAAGTVIGGIIGLLGGPAGVLIGGVLGGVIGNEGDKSELQKANYFNTSRI